MQKLNELIMGSIERSKALLTAYKYGLLSSQDVDQILTDSQDQAVIDTLNYVNNQIKIIGEKKNANNNEKSAIVKLS